MSNPKGMRTVHFSVSDTDAVHVYSDPGKVWLQLRRYIPTSIDLGTSSFKSTLCLSPAQAIAIAGELLTAATQQLKTSPLQAPKVESKPAASPAAAPAKKKPVQTTAANTKKAAAKPSPTPAKKKVAGSTVVPASKSTPDSAVADRPKNYGKPWTPEEDEKLAVAFDLQTPIDEMAKLYERGIGGVQTRLIKLGRLPAPVPTGGN